MFIDFFVSSGQHLKFLERNETAKRKLFKAYQEVRFHEICPSNTCYNLRVTVRRFDLAGVMQQPAAATMKRSGSPDCSKETEIISRFRVGGTLCIFGQ